MTNVRSVARVAFFEFVPLTLLVAVPLSVQAGFFSNLFASEAQADTTPEVVRTSSPVDLPVLASLQHPDPVGARGGGEIYVEDGALVSTGPAGADEIAESGFRSGEIRVYTVKPGDTASEIAEMFGVSVNTIYWANDIASGKNIRPGDTLIILPISGVRHEVEKNETLASIVKKYGGNLEEVIEYNQLASADDIAVGDEIVIPGGEVTRAAPSSVPASPTKISGNISAAATGFSHPLPGSVRTQGIHGYNGVDLAMPGNKVGASIRAAAAGEVIVSKSGGWNGGYGNYVVIKHSNGSQTLYAHMQSNAVGVGAWVNQGETIGYVGNTGRSTGPHLHFEVRGARNPF